MTPEKETELFALLNRLVDMGKAQADEIKALQTGQSHLADDVRALQTGQGHLADDVRALQAGQSHLADDVRALQIGQGRLEGQLSIIVQWMNSMDQRFMALMTPYKPPKPPKQTAA